MRDLLHLFERFCIDRRPSTTHVLAHAHFSIHSTRRRVDTYSFGVVISEVKSRELPFADVPRNQKTGFNPPLIRAIKAGKKRPRNDESWGAEICSLIDRCTRHLPAERPPFGEVARILKQVYEDSSKGGDERPRAGAAEDRARFVASVVSVVPPSHFSKTLLACC